MSGTGCPTPRVQPPIARPSTMREWVGLQCRVRVTRTTLVTDPHGPPRFKLRRWRKVLVDALVIVTRIDRGSFVRCRAVRGAATFTLHVEDLDPLGRAVFVPRSTPRKASPDGSLLASSPARLAQPRPSQPPRSSQQADEVEPLATPRVEARG